MERPYHWITVILEKNCSAIIPVVAIMNLAGWPRLRVHKPKESLVHSEATQLY